MVKFFYLGDLFKKSLRFSEKFNTSFGVVSAKFGYLHSTDIVQPYDLKITTKKQARELHSQIKKVLIPELNQYEAIFLVMGNLYLEALSLLFHSSIPIFRLQSKNGIFDYKKNIMKVLDGDFSTITQIHGIKTSFANLMDEKP